jgi:hypothetical protein
MGELASRLFSKLEKGSQKREKTIAPAGVEYMLGVPKDYG